MRRRTAVAAFAAAAVAAAIVPALAVGTTTLGSPGKGCAPDRPAVLHHAGGVVVAAGTGEHLVPCGVSTGFAGAESHIVALNNGAIVFTPAVIPHGLLGIGLGSNAGDDPQSNASPAGLAITRDAGTTWSFVKPAGVTWNPTDHGDYVDPVTGRLFFEDYGPIQMAPKFGAAQEGPAHINWSDDTGKTWHHTSINTVFLPENPRFTSARPPAGQPKPTGYPNVVYFCANTNVGFTSPVITGRRCFKSLDGGSSWKQTTTLLSSPVPRHAECGPNGEKYSAIDGYYPQPTHDGSLYVMIACGSTTYLARSTDEARTFPVIKVGGKPVTMPVPPPAGGLGLNTPDLRIGSDDTFYLMYEEVTGNREHLMLRLSRDRGRTWTTPLDVTAPGVTQVGHWALAQRGTQVAVAYLGRKEGQPTYDGYVTSSTDPLAVFSGGQPTFASGMVNDPKRPLLYGDDVQGAGYFDLPDGVDVPFPPPFDIHFAGNDFIGATIAPDGTPWGSFTQDCGPSRSSAGCQAQDDETRGFAGRLAVASATATTPS